jgi:integrase
LSRVNILKRVKIGARWKLLSIPHNDKGNPNWAALPEGRYFIEWYSGGKRRRKFGGTTVAQALESQKRKRHELEGRHLGLPGFDKAGEQPKNPPLHIAISHYLDQVETLKKPNTLRKYRAVLERFAEYFANRSTVRAISPEDLNSFIVDLMKNQHMAANTVIHNVIIIAQFLKRQGRPNITRELQLPGRVTTLPCEYGEPDLARFFGACNERERVLFSTFLMTGLREQEVVHLVWTDINFDLRVVRVTAKPALAFYPKRWEEREVPITVQLAELLRGHPRHTDSQFVFPSRTGNREQHMLDRCKAVAARGELDAARFDLKTFRSTYATRMLRAGFDVRTVQHWMGHKSLETTMRYLVPATDVHQRLDQLEVPGLSRHGGPRHREEEVTTSDKPMNGHRGVRRIGG